jgi:hypothetical protein
MLPFGVIGLAALRRRKLPISPYVAIAASVTLAAAMSFGITRYRAGADVALCVVAAIGIDHVVSTLRARHAGATPEASSATAVPA